ncbi:MAG: glycosyltransferase family 2 protein [Acetobacteraceae bacterium]
MFVVDDGSSDATAALARAAGATVLGNAARRGKGASLRRGMREALDRGSARIVTLDGDGQHQPSDIPRLVAASVAFPNHVVIGVRRRGGDRGPVARLLGNRFGSFWISLAARQRIDDAQSGFRVYPAALARRIVGEGVWHAGFAFESEVLIEAAGLGFRTIGVDVARIYGDVTARSSYFRPVRDTVSIAVVVTRQLLRRLARGLGLRHSGQLPIRPVR